MPIDDLIRQIEDRDSEDDRCQECGMLLSSTVVFIHDQEYAEYYCDNAECMRYHKTISRKKA